MKVSFDQPLVVVTARSADGSVVRTEYPGLLDYNQCDPAIWTLPGILVAIVKSDGEIAGAYACKGQDGINSLRDYWDHMHQGMACQVAYFAPASGNNIVDAIVALQDMGDPDSLRILNLIDRILADDYTGTGLYEAIDKALKLVEPAVSE